MIEAPADPRVDNAETQTPEPIPNTDNPRMVVACPTGAVVTSKEPPILTITQEEEDEKIRPQYPAQEPDELPTV